MNVDGISIIEVLMNEMMENDTLMMEFSINIYFYFFFTLPYSFSIYCRNYFKLKLSF